MTMEPTRDPLNERGASRPEVAPVDFESAERARGRHGFSLLEALVALALMGLVLAMLGTVTARWLPTWNIGFARLQRADLVGLAIERIAADLASAEFLSLARTRQGATFDGTASSVVFVRSALGPNAVEGLEIVKIAEQSDGDGFALVRSRAPFALLGQDDLGQDNFGQDNFGQESSGQQSLDQVVDSASIAFTDKITLLRSPFRASFAFAAVDLEWKDLWRGVPVLPSAVKITIEDARKPGPSASLIVSLHMNVAAVCARASSPSGCIDELTRTGAVRVGSDTPGQQR
jgi:general secretion pathway protein J